ncbi:MAG TPA: PKD domain-containing protein [Candidatus Dormibacteraeota bacterium]|nr:PKD domain-containing protein [Candidatus Dormibacteraeota bacterium]
MPASTFYSLAIFAILIVFSTAVPGMPGGQLEHSILSLQPTSIVSGLQQALDWLAVQNPANGSYGGFHEHWTAAAALALSENDSNSAEAARSYTYLADQMNSSSSWFWQYVEADVPGAVLYSIASGSNLGLINSSFVASELAQFQQSDGGFSGYYDSRQQQTVTSSVDTDMAVLGLTAANLDSSIVPAAAQYLLTLQNPDGSFNLTSEVRSDAFYSLGPDSASITALTLLALKSNGYTIANSPVIDGLQFLSASSADHCVTGHVYSAALSAVAFLAFHQPYRAVESMFYILSQQNQNGGFSDISRSSYPQSNALDAGWAAYALEQGLQVQGVNYQPTNCPPVATFVFNPLTIVEGQSFQFNASRSNDIDRDQLSYTWTFGDGTSSGGIGPVHVYNQAGNFTVSLTVRDSGTDPGPLSDSKSQTLQVQQGTIQKSPNLTLNPEGLLILAGVGGVVLVFVLGAAFYLGRKSMTRSRKSG